MKPAILLVLTLFAVAARAEEPADDARRIALRIATTRSAAVTDADAVDVARTWAQEFPADEMAARLAGRGELVPGLFGTLGAALATADDETAATLLRYATDVTRTWSRRDGPWSDADVRLLAAVVLVDPGRFRADERLRRRVLTSLPRAIDPASPARDRLLVLLSGSGVVDFDAFEDAAFAWGGLIRRSGERRHADGRLVLADEREAIRASLYSLPEDLFDDAEALAFLRGVRRASPERDLVVLTGSVLGERLRQSGLGLHLLPSHGFAFSPWPRDPLTFLRDAAGRQVVVLRPNAQSTREDDLWLGRVLLQGLPEELDAAWGRPRFARAEVPFHNGQVLAADGKLWVSVHSLEPRALELAGFDRVPVTEFAGAAGKRYVAAIRQAAVELGELYGRRVAFVHALPEEMLLEETQPVALLALGGGAGFDLDSLLTLLVRHDGGTTALVADLDAGAELLAAADGDELTSFAAAYALEKSQLTAVQGSPRARRLDGFLEAVASHLAGEARVRRLPLLLLPRGRDDGDVDFLVGWNNVVLEGTRAEGFASLLPSGDRRAREAYAEAGFSLELYPPLLGSVRRNGGYRCASQHVR